MQDPPSLITLSVTAARRPQCCATASGRLRAAEQRRMALGSTRPQTAHWQQQQQPGQPAPASASQKRSKKAPNTHRASHRVVTKARMKSRRPMGWKRNVLKSLIVSKADPKAWQESDASKESTRTCVLLLKQQQDPPPSGLQGYGSMNSMKGREESANKPPKAAGGKQSTLQPHASDSPTILPPRPRSSSAASQASKPEIVHEMDDEAPWSDKHVYYKQRPTLHATPSLRA
mmetsp:Transcript_5324/g.13117  ORF Transcript_5324/g.13117 Transcript_5324/m.13117 type:complete len:231 (+) Transcript_5324:606-1298(+)